MLALRRLGDFLWKLAFASTLSATSPRPSAVMNRIDERVGTSLVTVDPVFFDTRRQMLAAQVGWFREASPVYRRDFPAGSAGSTYSRRA